MGASFSSNGVGGYSSGGLHERGDSRQMWEIQEEALGLVVGKKKKSKKGEKT
jgi:hypothetical protein